MYLAMIAPAPTTGPRLPDTGMFEGMARIAERGLPDLIFSGDGTGVPDSWRG
jgi:hypothetical protein